MILARTNSDVRSVKSEGAVYTPPELAAYIADQMLEVASLPSSGPIYLLDPAMGDGVLLSELLAKFSPEVQARCVATGYEMDPLALSAGEAYLRKHFPQVDFKFQLQDFLAEELSITKYDLAIANPPYVRTQVMGAQQAQLLANKYGLTGRVDLYFPFLISIASALKPGGTMGVITSNRFLTTRSGQEVRKCLMSRFNVKKVIDLGDTKLFSAAVLPAITIAQGGTAKYPAIEFTSIYESSSESSINAVDVLSALSAPNGSVVGVGGSNFHVQHGVVDNNGDQSGVWTLSNSDTRDWLTVVEKNKWGTFADIGKIRVGIKSTADKIFLSADWGAEDEQPELLKSLITRHCGRRYRAKVPEKASHRKRVLYPHVVDADGKRRAADLGQFPRSKAYLELHREKLESRDYVIQGGRKWYELWVPQDPAAWSEPKLVFPDISERATFWMDLDGGVVNGECYFLRSESNNTDLLWLAMAVANSSFTEMYYDRCFNNKLYAGRRRWITQYVEKLPLPDPESELAAEIIQDAKRIYQLIDQEEASEIASDLDRKVWMAFGLLPKE